MLSLCVRAHSNEFIEDVKKWLSDESIQTDQSVSQQATTIHQHTSHPPLIEVELLEEQNYKHDLFTEPVIAKANKHDPCVELLVTQANDNQACVS